MNHIELAKIELRWLACSGERWVVQDDRTEEPGVPVLLPIPEDCPGLRKLHGLHLSLDGPVSLTCPDRRKVVCASSFEGAQRKGFKGGFDQWVGLLERTFVHGHADDLWFRFRRIAHPVSGTIFLAAQEATDADLSLVCNAPSDIGTLVEEVRTCWEEIARLKSALQSSEAACANAKNEARKALALVQQFRELAAKVAGLPVSEGS